MLIRTNSQINTSYHYKPVCLKCPEKSRLRCLDMSRETFKKCQYFSTAETIFLEMLRQTFWKCWKFLGCQDKFFENVKSFLTVGDWHQNHLCCKLVNTPFAKLWLSTFHSLSISNLYDNVAPYFSIKVL